MIKITKTMLPRQNSKPGKTPITTTETWVTNGHWCVRRDYLIDEQAALAAAGLLGQSLGVADVKALGGHGVAGIEDRINGWAEAATAPDGGDAPAALSRTNFLIDRNRQPMARAYLCAGAGAYAFADDAYLYAFGNPPTLRLLPEAICPLLVDNQDSPRYLLAACGDFRTRELHELVALLPNVGE